MGKAPKSMKKFAASGQLKKTIEARRKHQQIKKKQQSRRGRQGKGAQPTTLHDESDQDESQENLPAPKKGKMTVDDLLGGAFMENSENEGEEDEEVRSY
ncbi:Nucleolar Complex 2 protein [Stygiomarasmius scandens]|uniref:Nucleolar Complex 2 protein n=1 Tax=Marasmiellus scandens TaxID=2682957 RepID=A0ABR1IWK9_9AGAR